MKNRSRAAQFTLAGCLLLAACVPQDGITTGDPAMAGPVGLPPVVVLDAQRWLADELHEGVEDVRIVSMSQEEWSDSCLELGNPNEACAQTVTPGWRAIYDVKGKTYEVRTNNSGSTIRLASRGGELSAQTPLQNTHWSLVFFGPPGAHVPVIEGSRITLLLAGGEAGGYGGCNSYGAAYEIDGPRISFDRVRSTKRACPEQAITLQEQRYFEALQSASTYELDGTTLRITYDAGDGVMVFESAVPAAPDGAPATTGP